MSHKSIATLEAIRRDTERGLKAMRLLDHPAGIDLLRGYDALIEEAKARELRA